MMLSHSSLYAGLQELILSDYLYIDKSRRLFELLCELENAPRFAAPNIYLLIRPRGFGLSLAAGAIEKLTSRDRGILDKLSLTEEFKELPIHHVITLDFKNFNAQTPREFADELIERIQKLYWNQHIESHISPYQSPKGYFANLIAAVSKRYQEPAVIVIDNYDLPFMVAAEMPCAYQNEAIAFYLDMLNAIKHAGDSVSWCLLTGHIKFSLASEISEGLPFVNDISNDPRFETLFGLTYDEVQILFNEKIATIARDFSISPDDYMKALMSCYGGFCFSDNLINVMCPACISHAMANYGALYPYSATGDYRYLKNIFAKTEPNLKWLFDKDGQDPLHTWSVAMDPCGKEIGALLIQSGFVSRNKVTVHNYDAYTTWRYRFDYPNEDMRRSLLVVSGKVAPELAYRPFTPEELLEIDETQRFLDGEDVYELLKEEEL